LARAAGKPWQRVHAVTAPTPYLRFEIDVYYAQTEPSGEDIRILNTQTCGTTLPGGSTRWCR
jgi:hypothetical protein